jgi:hypothetical protein
MIKVRGWGKLSSWLTDSHFLAVSSQGRASKSELSGVFFKNSNPVRSALPPYGPVSKYSYIEV